MNQTESASKHTIIASWVFGSILLLFYMAVFAFMPASLPDYKHKMLAILSALLCGLFMFFLVGSLKVTINLSNKSTKWGIQSGGGAAAFVLILWCGVILISRLYKAHPARKSKPYQAIQLLKPNLYPRRVNLLPNSNPRQHPINQATKQKSPKPLNTIAEKP
jgi:hypothetical protein